VSHHGFSDDFRDLRDDRVAERRNGAVAQTRRKYGIWPIIHSTKRSSSARRCETSEAALPLTPASTDCGLRGIEGLSQFPDEVGPDFHDITKSEEDAGLGIAQQSRQRSLAIEERAIPQIPVMLDASPDAARFGRRDAKKPRRSGRGKSWNSRVMASQARDIPAVPQPRIGDCHLANLPPKKTAPAVAGAAAKSPAGQGGASRRTWSNCGPYLGRLPTTVAQLTQGRSYPPKKAPARRTPLAAYRAASLPTRLTRNTSPGRITSRFASINSAILTARRPSTAVARSISLSLFDSVTTSVRLFTAVSMWSAPRTPVHPVYTTKKRRRKAPLSGLLFRGRLSRQPRAGWRLDLAERLGGGEYGLA
jgi:hypothetical protein